MIKSELISSVSSEMTHLPQRVVSDCVNHILDLMTYTLADGRRIEIRGFGSFSLHDRPPRNAHNPKTGAKVLTQRKFIPHFKPGKELRLRVEASRGKIPIQEE